MKKMCMLIHPQSETQLNSKEKNNTVRFIKIQCSQNNLGFLEKSDCNFWPTS